MMNKKRFYFGAAFILVLGVFVGLVLSSRLNITSPLPAKSQISSKSIDTDAALRSPVRGRSGCNAVGREYIHDEGDQVAGRGAV